LAFVCAIVAYSRHRNPHPAKPVVQSSLLLKPVSIRPRSTPEGCASKVSRSTGCSHCFPPNGPGCLETSRITPATSRTSGGGNRNPRLVSTKPQSFWESNSPFESGSPPRVKQNAISSSSPSPLLSRLIFSQRQTGWNVRPTHQ